MNKYWCSSFFIVDKQSAVVVGDDSINIDYSQFFLLCSRKKNDHGPERAAWHVCFVGGGGLFVRLRIFVFTQRKNTQNGEVK